MAKDKGGEFRYSKNVLSVRRLNFGGATKRKPRLVPKAIRGGDAIKDVIEQAKKRKFKGV